MNYQKAFVRVSLDQFIQTELCSRNGKKATRKLAKEYGPILDSFNDVVFITDEAGHFVFVNKTSEQRTGVPTEKVIGRHFLELIDPKYHEFAQNSFKKAINGEQSAPTIEMERKTVSGEKITLEINWKTLYENNIAVGLLGVCRDVTIRKHAEEKLKKANEELEIRVKDHTENLQREPEWIKNAIIEWKRNEDRMKERIQKGYGD